MAIVFDFHCFHRLSLGNLLIILNYLVGSDCYVTATVQNAQLLFIDDLFKLDCNFKTGCCGMYQLNYRILQLSRIVSRSMS